ncbi:ATP-binding protein [Thermofilum sp.]|uniref:ATP-binding protein n=1 Tax=Thermofilum sp. TaxID=1961369 RepID=UPI0031655FE0
MSSQCVEKLVRFIDRLAQRVSLSDLEEIFKVGFEENPVFGKIFELGAHAKNLIILVGARGSGKTVTYVYLKHLLEREGWKFVYYRGEDLKVEDRVKNLYKELSEVEESVKGGKRVALAFDDVIEATPLFTDFVKANLIRLLLAEGMEGRVKLMFALQSEAEKGGLSIIEWLNTAVSRAEGAEMLFGEDPDEMLKSAVESSYAERVFVKTFRGASVVNLDAFWARYRDLNAVPDLGEAIMSIFNFYARNAGVESECADLHKELKAVRKGLALLALATLPLLSSRTKVVVEYAEWGLNAMSILRILRKVMVDRHSYTVAKALSDLYDSLSKTEVPKLEPKEDVISAILKACTTVQKLVYNVRNVVEKATPDMLGLGVQHQPARGRRGPEFALVHVSRKDPVTGKTEDRYVAFTYLRKDSQGYVRTETLNRLRKLVNQGVPEAAEGRYLVVLVPSKSDSDRVYKAVRMNEIGRSVFILSIESIKGIMAVFTSGYASNKLLDNVAHYGIPAETLEEILGRVAFSTLVFTLRDLQGRAVLAELLLPELSELKKEIPEP